MEVFQFRPLSKDPVLVPGHFRRGRSLIGRAESCEFVIPRSYISAVHAVLEVTSHGAKIYDMNSRNGVLVNGEKVVAKELRIGDRVTIGNIEYVFEKYSPVSEFPPVLDSLEPTTGTASVFQEQVPVAPPVGLPKKPEELPATAEQVPYIVYPLSQDPKADYSEYIFEDSDDLYPIFKYEHNKAAVEVIILFNDRVYSVDYVPEKNGVIKLVGANPKKSDVEFPYLATKEAVPLIEMNSGNCVVRNLHNYEMMHLSDKELKHGGQSVNLQGDELVRLTSGALEIYIRKTFSPPKVKAAPFFRRDKNLKKYIFLALIFVLVPIVGLNFFEVDEEIEKEKDPDRIARILYKQELKVSPNKAVEKTENKPKVNQTVKHQVTEVKKTEEQKPVVEKTSPQPRKKRPTRTTGVKTAKKTEQVKRAKNPAPKTNTVAKTAGAARSKPVTTKSAARAVRPSKSQGAVDVYKSFDFKSTVNTLMAKGGTVSSVNTASSDASSISSTNVGGGVSDAVKTADATSDIGSITGAATGKLSDSKGVEGISAKKGIITAGIPSETVVLGSMDPDVIRRILREHIAQFRSCYQKELDANMGQEISGVIRLNFQIGASGHVTQASATSNRFPAHVRACVARVLKGISFPSPKGGGVVDVRQPFNFYAGNK